MAGHVSFWVRMSFDHVTHHSFDSKWAIGCHEETVDAFVRIITMLWCISYSPIYVGISELKLKNNCTPIGWHLFYIILDWLFEIKPFSHWMTWDLNTNIPKPYPLLSIFMSSSRIWCQESLWVWQQDSILLNSFLFKEE